MGIIRLFIFLLVSAPLFSSAFDGKPFGTFSGVLHHENLKKDQLIKLELIPLKETGENTELEVILSLQFGGYESGEYISYHFHDVQFNTLTRILTLNEVDQDIYINDAKITDNIFEGILYTTSGKVGAITLNKINDISPSSPLIEPLNGEYRGTCGTTHGNLQIFTYRSTNEKSHSGNPFGAYEVKGQFGKSGSTYCSKDLKKYCTQSKIKSATYDFFNGSLILEGEPESYNCHIDGSKLNCGECQLQRISAEMIKPEKVLKNVLKKPFLNSDLKKRIETPNNSISGLYTGYLYHNQLDSYQKVQIDVSSFQKTNPHGSSLILAVTARLQFGESKTEILYYRFDPVEYPNSLINPQFIFSRQGDKIDALLQVTELREGIIQGNWYSLIFGKVGTFFVSKNSNQILLPKTVKKFESISAKYIESDKKNSDNDLELDLSVSQVKAPLNSDNPFFPLSIKGALWRKSGMVKKENILESSYDFFTGRIAFNFRDEQIMSGYLDPNKQIKFRKMGRGYGTYMQSFDLMPFKKIIKDQF